LQIAILGEKEGYSGRFENARGREGPKEIYGIGLVKNAETKITSANEDQKKNTVQGTEKQ